MTVRLTVRTALWRAHVARTAAGVADLVPVVKGNGYGFGRVALATIAAELSDTVAVGTIHELAGLPDGLDAVVLTPTLEAPPTTAAILTVGQAAHIDALAGAGWRGRVVVKHASSMRRFGRGPELADLARAAGLDVVGVSVHPPTAGTTEQHRDEVAALLPDIDPALPVWVSHLDGDALASLPTTHRYRLRLGTALWHGDKSFLHLDADVLDVHPVRAGDRVGYRQHAVAGPGHVVVVGGGTAHGIAPLADGSSPFHHLRRRLPLVEPPHMHVSMAFVAAGEPRPDVGDRVDVQRPLITTFVDRIDWI